MFKNTLLYYIDYMIYLKDEEIYLNFLLLNDIFIKYYNNEIIKDYLLDEHTIRNKLFMDWKIINDYNGSLYIT
jgi:hypothetical protein